jgi:hypothetical protein
MLAFSGTSALMPQQIAVQNTKMAVTSTIALMPITTHLSSGQQGWY